MKTYILILILINVFFYSRALDEHEGDRSKNNDEVVVLTPDFENKKPLNISTAEETTPPILCAICDPTVNLKDDNGKSICKNRIDNRNSTTTNTEQIVPIIGSRTALRGDECPFGLSRADDGNCVKEE